MTLKEFKDKHSLSYKKLANLIGAGDATIARRWCLPKSHKDAMIPDRRYMSNIITVTMGEVMPNDFYCERD
tara:strand:+ start:2267 stop:2479 length:213 start_codon:yes stop_codon:yes gene_type:complete